MKKRRYAKRKRHWRTHSLLRGVRRTIHPTKITSISIVGYPKRRKHPGIRTAKLRVGKRRRR